MKKIIILVVVFFIMVSLTFALFNQTPINVSQGGDHNCIVPRMAVDKWGNIHVVWEEYLTESNNEIMYRKYTAQGWSEKINISNNSWPSREPDVAVDEKGNAYIVWLDTFNTSGFKFSVAFREIDANGKMKEIKKILPQPGSNFRLPSIASSPTGDLQVVSYTHNYKVYGTHRENNQWSTPHRIHRPSAKFAGESAYVVWGKNGKFYGVWPEYNPSTDDAMTVYLASREIGKNWTIPDVVNATGDAQGHPRIIVDEDGTIHVVWMDEEGSRFDIVYEKWDPQRKKWEMPLIVSNDGDLSNLPSLTKTAAGEIYVGWVIGAWGHLKNAFYSIQDKNGNWNKSLSFLESGINNAYFTEFASGGPNDNVFFIYAESVKTDNKKEVFLLTKKPIEVSAMLYPPKTVSVSTIETIKLNPSWKNSFNLVSWTANDENSKNDITVVKYRIYRKGKGENDSKFVKIGEVDANVFSYYDSTFEKGKEYDYGVSSVDKETNESSIKIAQ